MPDTDPSDGEHRLSFEWGDPHVNFICHAPEEVDRADGVLVCSGLYRHATHTQVLRVIDVPAVIAVLPPDVRPDSDSAPDALRAFAVEPGDTLVLHRGTWHWGPFPSGDLPVTLLNVQSRRYLEDNDFAALTDPVAIVIDR